MLRVQYDALPKYCKTYRLQGHNEEGCRKLNPNLRNYYKNDENNREIEVNDHATAPAASTPYGSNNYPPRTVSCFKVVGDLDEWTVVESRKSTMEMKTVNKTASSSTKPTQEKCLLPINSIPYRRIQKIWRRRLRYSTYSCCFHPNKEKSHISNTKKWVQKAFHST